MDLGPCIESQGGMFPTGTLAMEHHHFSRSFYLHIDLQHSTHCDLLEYIYNTDTHIYTGDGAGVFSSLHICAKPRTENTRRSLQTVVGTQPNWAFHVLDLAGGFKIHQPAEKSTSQPCFRTPMMTLMGSTFEHPSEGDSIFMLDG